MLSSVPSWLSAGNAAAGAPEQLFLVTGLWKANASMVMVLEVGSSNDAGACSSGFGFLQSFSLPAEWGEWIHPSPG